MKRKRSEQKQLDDSQTCDFVLTDANGKSVRVHKALLMSKSDYFAQLLSENNLSELQLDEKYLVELIRYLYNHEGDDYCMSPSSTIPKPAAVNIVNNSNSNDAEDDSNGSNSDIKILMHLLCMSKRYYFKQLYVNILNEIEYKLNPTTVITIYKMSKDLNLQELHESARLLILSWLPKVQKLRAFLKLPVDNINDIFEAEDSDIDNECKLNALSAWWAHNKDKDMTNLWVKLIGCPAPQE